MKIKYGKIYLPHINYTVTIKRLKPPPEVEHMAYLMQYLMGCMFGYEWIGRPKKKKVKKRCRKRS